MLMWGSLDSVLPVGHAYQARSAMPGSRLEIFEGAGHFPFRSEPLRFVSLLEEFVETTAPAQWGVDQWRELLREGRRLAASHNEPPGYQADLRAASERSAT